MNTVYLLLGTNVGNTTLNLATAKRHIQNKIGKINRSSSIYSTEPWGQLNQPGFLNQVIVIQSMKLPIQILESILKIEKSMGRIRTIQYAPRIIDIDILFYNKETISLPDLIIPHPLIQERKFVLTPLNELSPNYKHPLIGKSMHQLLQACNDQLAVHKI